MYCGVMLPGYQALSQVLRTTDSKEDQHILLIDLPHCHRPPGQCLLWGHFKPSWLSLGWY